MPVVPLRPTAPSRPEPSRVAVLRAPAVDAERLVAGLRAGHRGAERELLQRYSPIVRTVLARILGTRNDLDDLTQEVFIRALDRLSSLREADALGPWLTRFAVLVAKESLRAQRRKRWLLFFTPSDMANLDVRTDDKNVHDNAAAVRATYEVLDAMSPDTRLYFSLRYLHDMDLSELADAFDVSLATAKRRLAEANATFAARARNHPVLRAWAEEGKRWGS